MRRVSRAPRPAGSAPPLDHGVPDRGRVRGRDEQLDAVLPGVAGAADEHAGRARDRQLGGVEAGGQLAVGQRTDESAGLRSLDRDHREVLEAVDHGRVGARRVRLEPGQVALVVGGVGDGQIAIRPEPVGEEVVEHAAVLVAEQRVLRAALRELGHVVAHEPLEQGAGAGAAGLDLAHVADVEDARALAHGGVLGTDPGGVLDGHLPAGEGDEARARGHVPVVQRRAPQGVRVRRHRDDPTLARGPGANRPRARASAPRPSRA